MNKIQYFHVHECSFFPTLFTIKIEKDFSSTLSYFYSLLIIFIDFKVIVINISINFCGFHSIYSSLVTYLQITKFYLQFWLFYLQFYQFHLHLHWFNCSLSFFICTLSLVQRKKRVTIKATRKFFIYLRCKIIHNDIYRIKWFFSNW